MSANSPAFPTFDIYNSSSPSARYCGISKRLWVATILASGAYTNPQNIKTHDVDVFMDDAETFIAEDERRAKEEKP